MARSPQSMALHGTGHGFSWSPDFDVEMLNVVQREALACVVLHYHGGRTPELGQTSDVPTANSLMPFLSREAGGRPHLFGVVGDHAINAVAFQDGIEVGALDAYTVSSRALDPWRTKFSSRRRPLSEERHDRLVRGFGPGAQARLRRTTVGVVGCGGGGSHVVQQLAYLGVGGLVLVDPDLVEETNLNRLIGAYPESAPLSWLDRLLRRQGGGDVGRPKVEVMERMIHQIDPTIDVHTHQQSFPTTATAEALRTVDIVVACVDRLQVRDDLNRLCKRYLIPMIDIGIEIALNRGRSGEIVGVPGRVTKVLPDGPCLRCQGVVSDELLERERSGRPTGYAGDATLPDPAVVTLNGVVASLAATEVLQLVTSFAGPHGSNCGWIFDGLTGATETAGKTYVPNRPCEHDRGRGDL
jgi:molybdopterin/thiamine biosynthesis adenylyltransferase